MTDSLDFFFDFSSPYGYLASTQVDALAERFERSVRWRPYLMGVVMKITGSVPLVTRPMIDAYSIHDMHRSARLLDVPFRLPDPFPVPSVGACRAYYWIEARGSVAARAAAAALFRALFVDGRNIGETDVVLDVLAEQGHDRTEAADALRDPAVKARLEQAVEDAVEIGVFGSPMFVVDGEPFWGHDRLAQVEQWLETGGW